MPNRIDDLALQAVRQEGKLERHDDKIDAQQAHINEIRMQVVELLKQLDQVESEIEPLKREVLKYKWIGYGIATTCAVAFKLLAGVLATHGIDIVDLAVRATKND